MKRIIIGFMICLLFVNCTKKNKTATPKRDSYIISYEDKKLQDYKDSTERNSNKKIFITKGFYAESQLVIDKDDKLFFYQKRYIQILCNYGNENDTLPHFLDLQPKDLVKIPESCLQDFLSENILSKEKNRQILIIASQKDTIKNKSFLYFLDHNKIPTYLIRKTTQEEDTVLHYKATEKHYYSDEIKWDTTRIKLPTKN